MITILATFAALAIIGAVALQAMAQRTLINFIVED